MHVQIVSVARRAREKMVHWKSSIEGGTAEARKAAKHVVQPELHELDELVTELLRNHKMKSGIGKKRRRNPKSLRSR